MNLTNSHRIWRHICKTAQANTQAKFCKRAAKPTLDKNRQEMITKQTTVKEGRRHNIGFAKWRVKCFYDSLVQGTSLVFQMNICAKNPPLRKAEKRQAVKKLSFDFY